MIGILDIQNVVAEAWNHKQLLIERVHVADATEILDTDMTSCRLLILVETQAPVTFFVCAPTWILIEALHVFEDHEQVFNAVCAQHVQ